MNTNEMQFPAKNPNLILSVAKDGTVLYSNKAGEPLLHEWGTKEGEKLPSNIVNRVQMVIAQNNPEKIEVKAGKGVFLVVFSPLLKQECVNISGFDISDQKEVEGKLRENENKYRNIVETSVEGIWIFNAVSETTYVNEKMAEMLGYEQEEMFGKFIWDFAYQEDKDIFQVKLANRKQGIDEVYELKLLRKDGSPLWVSVSAKGFFDDAGKFKGSVGMFTDITDRKGAEEALRQSKARVESIFRSSPVGIGVVVDRIIKEANERLCEMTGYSREELLGKSALMLYPTTEEYERVGEIKYGMIEESGIGTLETRWQRKDGSIIDILLSSSPIVPHDLSGEITFTALDITERKRVEESLRESEEKYRIVADNTSDWEFWLGSDGRFLYMSHSCERVTGYAVWEFLDNPDLLQEIIHPDDRQAFIQHKHDTSPSRPGDLEFRIITKDGEIRWIHHLCLPIYDDNGCYAGNRGSNRDITERKRAEETLAFERSQLLSIFEGINDVVYVTDPYTYEVLYANKAMKENFGGELVGGICYRAFQQRDSPCDFCTNPIILKERYKPYHWEYYNPTVDRYFMIMDRIIKWPDGRDVRLEIAKDITKRKRAEEALRISEEKYRSLFNSIDEGFNIIEMIFDDSGKSVDYRILEANPSQEKMTGLKDVVGKRARELIPNFEDYWLESFGQVAITGEPVRLENRIEELDRWFDVYASRFGGEGSRKVAVVFNDITQRKRAEEALHQSEKRLNFALETIHTGAWDLDLLNHDSPHRSLEHDRIFGYEQLLPKWTYEMFLNHVLPEDRAMVDEKFQKAITSGVDWSFECRIRRVDGVIRWIWAAGRHQVDAMGNVRRMAGIVQDITERKRVEEALKKANETLEVKVKERTAELEKAYQFLKEIEIIRKQEIHHRIKNNLQVISSLLDLQAEKFKSKKYIRDSEVLEAFRESQDRVISMALVHEELHKGGEIDTLNFSHYIEELAENLLLTYRVGNKGISLDMDIEEDIFFDMDTAVPLGIIINELISNSLKHAFPDRDYGEIRIKLKREECKSTSHVLSISDNGIGISEDIDIEDLDSLGLQLVSTLVVQLDGELEMRRDNGTEFIIRFTVTERENLSSTSAPQLI